MQPAHPWPLAIAFALISSLALAPAEAASQSAEPVRSSGGMVVSQQWIASQVGADVLEAG